MAARDQRAGMDAILTGTLTPADACAVLELYADHVPTVQARQRAFELMTVLDQVATRKRQDREAAQRKAAHDAAQSGRHR